MNIGDRVRLLHGKEEGIIRKFVGEKIVEVEIEDGFSLPVLRSEVVKISADEAIIFKNKPSSEDRNTIKSQSKSDVFADKGIYMAFIQINDQKLSLHLINNTEWDLPFVLFQEDGQNTTGLQSGFLNSRSEVKIHDVSMQNFEKWGSYVVQILFYKTGFFTMKEPFVRKIRFRANTFFKNKTTAPVLGKEAYVFQLDNEIVKIEPKEIIEKMFSGNEENNMVFPTKSLLSKSGEEDLHIEVLKADFSGMSNAEILKFQLSVFEKKLDHAIVDGLSEITFIHGAGNGVLRNEIHRLLSKNKNIAFFQDAKKEKFGYGATLVKLK